jgi:hypothetical protein
MLKQTHTGSIELEKATNTANTWPIKDKFGEESISRNPRIPPDHRRDRETAHEQS